MVYRRRREQRQVWRAIKPVMLVVVAVLFVAGVLPFLAPVTARAATGGVLYSPNLSTYPNADASYPRVIRLEANGSANGTLLATFSRSGHGGPSDFPIYRSLDGGVTWSASPISVVSDTVHGWSIDAPTLFELPQAVGTLPAGAILAAGTAWIHGPIVNGSLTGADYRQQDMQVYVSLNQGQSWSYHSSCASSSNMPNQPGYGIWEPSFALDSQGRLVCYYSDERLRDSGYNQTLSHTVWNTATQSWGAPAFDVAVQDNQKRPGMSIVVKLPNGQYMMSYELCLNGFDPDTACAVYVKTSPDGVNWAPVDSLGTRVETTDGRHFLHTPYLAWSPAGGPNGTLLLAGQRLVTGPDGGPVNNAPGNGRTLMVSTNLGAAGSWYELPAPFTVDPVGYYSSADAASGCAAYSPVLLPSKAGTSVLYLAGVQIANGNCEARFGTAGIGSLPFYAPLANGIDAGWTTYGGSWTVTGGEYRNTASGAGHKAVAGSTAWGDYTLQADVRLDGAGQAGLIARVTSPGTGSDAFRGYYVGIESSTGNLIIGRMDNNYTGLGSVALSGGVSVGSWYRLVVQVVGCTITASAQPVTSTATPTTLSVTNTGCFATGQMGVRSHFTPASWRNVTVTASGIAGSSPAPYLAPFASGGAPGWTTYGGTWSVANDEYRNTSGGAGEKSVAGNSTWTNYTVQADVSLTSLGANANAGLIARVANPTVGVDALRGYYAGISSGGTLVVGKFNNNWTFLGDKAIPGGVSTGQWYHVTLQVRGCELTATAQSAGSYDQAAVVITDAGCTQTTGQVGVRTFNAGSSWRYLTVTSRS